MTDDTSPRAFSIDEACKRVGCCRDKIYGAINAGQLRAKKLGRRSVVLAQDLDDFLKNLPAIKPKTAA